MSIWKEDESNTEGMYLKHNESLGTMDPEFVELFDNFTFDEVRRESKLENHTRFISILAVLIGSQAVEEYEVVLEAIINVHVFASEVKEIVYQGCAYLGIGRIYPFLHATNRVLKRNNVCLPLDPNKTVTSTDRLEKGVEAQVSIFGDQMKTFYKEGVSGREHVNRWLAANCFGDYYTRKTLDFAQRELITFCFLYAQGGCEPQLLSHIIANIKNGNDVFFLMDVVSQCIPYIGYPRSLNAFTMIDQASNQLEGK